MPGERADAAHTQRRRGGEGAHTRAKGAEFRTPQPATCTSTLIGKAECTHTLQLSPHQAQKASCLEHPRQGPASPTPSTLTPLGTP